MPKPASAENIVPLHTRRVSRSIQAFRSMRSRWKRCASTCPRSSAASATLTKRRTVKKEWQAAWLVKALQCIDLTTLNGDDTGRPRATALRQGDPAPAAGHLRLRWAWAIGASAPPRCASTRSFIAVAKDALAGSGIPVAAVSAAIPSGLAPLDTRIAEIKACVAEGADEIDIVITREHVLTGNWRALYDEIRAPSRMPAAPCI